MRVKTHRLLEVGGIAKVIGIPHGKKVPESLNFVNENRTVNDYREPGAVFQKKSKYKKQV